MKTQLLHRAPPVPVQGKSILARAWQAAHTAFHSDKCVAHTPDCSRDNRCDECWGDGKI